MSWQLSNEELIQKIALGEDSHLELKQLVFRGDSDRPSAPRPDGVADEIAAFANSRDGGVLVLGVEDGTRRILGIPRARLAAVQQWLDGIVNDRIKGPPRLVSVIFEAEDDSGQQKALIRLNIPPSIEVHRSPGGHFDRSVHGKRPMSQEALARLLQQRSQVGLIRFEEEPPVNLECHEYAASRATRPPGRHDAGLLAVLLDPVRPDRALCRPRRQ